MTMLPNDIITYAQSMQPSRNTPATNMQTYVINHSDNTHTLLQHNNKEYTIPTNKLTDIHAILNLVHPCAPYQIIYNIQPDTFDDNILVCNHQHIPHEFSINVPIRANNNKEKYYIINTQNIPPVSCVDISIADAMNKMNTAINDYFRSIFPNDENTSITHNTHIIHYITDDIPHHPDIKFMAYIHGHHASNHLTIEVMIDYNEDVVFSTHFTLAPNCLDDINESYNHVTQQIIDHINHNPNIYTYQKSHHYYISLIHAMGPYLTSKDSPLRTNIRRCAQDMLNHYTYQP